MKIIDLLNKIANGEEIPKLIKYANIIYFFKEDVNDKYLYTSLTNKCFFEHIFDLNDEVEIIEEDKKIEKIGYYDRLYDGTDEADREDEIFIKGDYDKDLLVGSTSDEETKIIVSLIVKINEIIDYINKEKEND